MADNKTHPKAGTTLLNLLIQNVNDELGTPLVAFLRKVVRTVPAAVAFAAIVMFVKGNDLTQINIIALVVGHAVSVVVIVHIAIAIIIDYEKDKIVVDNASVCNFDDHDTYCGMLPVRPVYCRLCQFLYIVWAIEDIGTAYIFLFHGWQLINRHTATALTREHIVYALA